MFKKRWFKESYAEGQKNFTKSLTIPDQTLSIPELIRRYASGQSLGAGVRTPIFDDVEDEMLQGKPLAFYDLSEQKQIMNYAKSEYDKAINARNKKNQPVGETPEKGVSDNGNQAPD